VRFVPFGALRMRLRSVWSLFTDLLNNSIDEWVNGLDLAIDIPKIGTARETAVQFVKMFGHFLSSGDMICSRNSELINSKPDLVHTCNESRIPAVTGHKVGGCSLR
jgi:hypothetical protein